MPWYDHAESTIYPVLLPLWRTELLLHTDHKTTSTVASAAVRHNTVRAASHEFCVIVHRAYLPALCVTINNSLNSLNVAVFSV
jgi:hypothetical protein